MPVNCRCDCDDCHAATNATRHCHLWPCRYATISITRSPSSGSTSVIDPAHASAVWHNSVRGCVECEWDRLMRWCRDNGVISSSHGPKDFTDKMIDFLKCVRGIP